MVNASKVSFVRRLKSTLACKCPKCLVGDVFSGLATMRETCPNCGHQFEREPGYFLGAMYVSYFTAIPVLGLLALLIYWIILPDWELQNVVLVAVLPFLLAVPIIWRYSRVIWMHFDHP